MVMHVLCSLVAMVFPDCYHGNRVAQILAFVVEVRASGTSKVLCLKGCPMFCKATKGLHCVVLVCILFIFMQANHLGEGCSSCLSQSRKTTPSPVKEGKSDAKRGKKMDVGSAVAKREETTAAAFFGSAPIKRTQAPRKRKEREEVEMSNIAAETAEGEE